MKRSTKLLALSGIVAGLNACGTPAPSEVSGFGVGTGGNAAGPSNVIDGGPRVGSGRYLPLAVGATWTYRAVDSATGISGTTNSVVEVLEDVGGVKAGTMAYRVKSTLLAGGATINWQQDLSDSVVRHREQFLDSAGVIGTDYIFKPYRLRLDESPARLVAGTTWTENNTADITVPSTGATASASYTVTWTVEAVDEIVAVPAGSFSCLRVRRVQKGYSSSDEIQWFARGVGKVKENGAENKELQAFTIP